MMSWLYPLARVFLQQEHLKRVESSSEQISRSSGQVTLAHNLTFFIYPLKNVPYKCFKVVTLQTDIPL